MLLPPRDWFHNATGTSELDEWYLRLRLQSLGLPEWAASLTSDEVFFFFSSWEFFHVAEYGSQEKDVYLISTESQLIDHPRDGVPAWEVLGPGVFFDFQVTGSESGLPLNDIEAGFDASLLQSNDRVEFESEDEIVRLVSNDAIIRETQRGYQSTGNTMWDGEDFTYVVDLLGNWDAKRGSSGGGLFAYPETGEPMHYVGLYFGNIGEPALLELGWNHDDPLGPDDERVSTAATPLDDRMASDRRDNRGNDGNPHRSDRDTCAGGGDLDCFDNCVDYCKDAPPDDPICIPGSGESCWELLVGELPPETEAVHTGCVGQGCDGTGGDEQPPKTRESRIFLNCKRNYLATFDPVVETDTVHGLGLIGAPTTYNTGDLDSALGTIGVICGPFSAREWSMNWDFISAEWRRQSSDQLDGVDGFKEFDEGPTLSRLLHRVALSRLPLTQIGRMFA